MGTETSDATPRRKASGRARHEEPLSIRQLEVFVALIDCGSFTSAAKSLGLSQPTVSGHMTDLEQRLGLRLINRSRTGLQPTKEGKALLRPAREALHSERNVRSGAAEMKGLVAGRVIVGGSSIPSTHILPEKLAKFRAQHPDVRVEIHCGNSAEILAGVTEDSVDMAIIGTEPPRRRSGPIQAVPLLDDHLVLICSPDSPLAAPRPLAASEALGAPEALGAQDDLAALQDSLATLGPISIPEVLEQPLLVRPSGSGSRAAMLLSLNLQDADVARHVSIQVETNEAIKASVRAGLGVSMVSALSVTQEIADGTLRSPSVAGLVARKRTYWLAYGRDEQLSPAARSLLKVLAGKR